MDNSTLDRVLIAIYWLFAFIGLVFEPLYYFGCDWAYENCPSSNSIVVSAVGQLWLIYAKWDPLFYTIPNWLRVLCSIEVFIFGPLYALNAYGLQVKARWLPFVALPFNGALVYSTLVYFAMEFIWLTPGTNALMVLLINIPWTIFPVIMMLRVVALTPNIFRNSDQKIS